MRRTPRAPDRARESLHATRPRSCRGTPTPSASSASARRPGRTPDTIASPSHAIASSVSRCAQRVVAPARSGIVVARRSRRARRRASCSRASSAARPLSAAMNAGVHSFAGERRHDFACASQRLACGYAGSIFDRAVERRDRASTSHCASASAPRSNACHAAIRRRPRSARDEIALTFGAAAGPPRARDSPPRRSASAPRRGDGAAHLAQALAGAARRTAPTRTTTESRVRETRPHTTRPARTERATRVTSSIA